MQNKDLVIICLIIVIIYLYYQQENKSVSPHLKQLQTELKHYQSLYQKRVEKNLLDTETLNSEWEIRYNQLENLNNQTNREKNELAKYQVLLEKKVADLEQQLLNLAKQKIKTKKDAEKLLTNLEIQWKQKIQNLEQTNQEQLRKINLLFDEQAKDYQFIDFDGLYSLLSQIAEREKESKSSDDENGWDTAEE